MPKNSSLAQRFFKLNEYEMSQAALPKLTIKQEKFARQYIGPCEGNASAAYRKAYSAGNMSDEAVWVAASRLLSHTKVSLWVDHLKAEYAAHEAITIEEITTGLRRAAEAAAGAGQHSAATQAFLGLAKLGGLLVEKRQVSVDDARQHLDAVAELASAPKPAVHLAAVQTERKRSA